MSKLSEVICILAGLDVILVGIVILFSVMECTIKQVCSILLYVLSVALFLELGAILVAYGAGSIII